VGDEGVGKTSLVMQFINHTFPEAMDPTISDLYKTTIARGDGTTINVELMDMCLPENITMGRANGFVIVYSLDNENSFKHVPDYVNKIIHLETPILFLGNKLDVKERRVVTAEQGQSYTKGIGLDKYFSEVSAKTGENVDEAFCLLINDCIPHKKRKKVKV